MKSMVFGVLALGVCLTGCNKSKPEQTAPPPSSSPVNNLIQKSDGAAPPPPGNAGAAPAPATSAAPAQDREEPGLTALNRALSAYIMGQLKEPGSLDDLVKAGLIKRLPTPPPGKKFTLTANKTAVVMVDR